MVHVDRYMDSPEARLYSPPFDMIGSFPHTLGRLTLSDLELDLKL